MNPTAVGLNLQPVQVLVDAVLYFFSDETVEEPDAKRPPQLERIGEDFQNHEALNFPIHKDEETGRPLLPQGAEDIPRVEVIRAVV